MTGLMAVSTRMEEFNFGPNAPRTPTKTSMPLPPVPSKPFARSGTSSPRSAQSSPLPPRPSNSRPALAKQDAEAHRLSQIHDYYAANLNYTLKNQPQGKRSSTDSRGSGSGNRLSCLSLGNTPLSSMEHLDLPTDRRSRALWFLKTIGTAGEKQTAAQVSPNFYFPARFWTLEVLDQDIVQSLDSRVRALKKVLKYQSSFEKEMPRLLKTLQQATMLPITARGGFNGPPTPPNESVGKRAVSGSSTKSFRLEEQARSVGSGLRFTRGKSDIILRYAEVAVQLEAAVKRECSFGLETMFVDFVLDTIVPHIVDDFFDLHALFMESQMDRLEPEFSISA